MDPETTCIDRDGHSRVVVSVAMSRVSQDVPSSRLGLDHLLLVPETYFLPNYADHINTKLSYSRNSDRRRSLLRLRSFEVN